MVFIFPFSHNINTLSTDYQEYSESCYHESQALPCKSIKYKGCLYWGGGKDAGLWRNTFKYTTILAINALLSLLPQNFSLCETQYTLINWTERHNLGMLLPTNSVGRTSVTYKTSPYIQNLLWSLLTAKREGKSWTWKKDQVGGTSTRKNIPRKNLLLRCEKLAHTLFTFRINNPNDNKSVTI